MDMDIREIARLMDPEEFEWYAAKLITGAQPLGRIGRAMHVLDHEHVPALILCKHLVYEIQDVFKLNQLMITYNFKRAYLITPGEFDDTMRAAVKSITNEIILLDGNALDDLRWATEETHGTDHH